MDVFGFAQPPPWPFPHCHVTSRTNNSRSRVRAPVFERNGRRAEATRVCVAGTWLRLAKVPLHRPLASEAVAPLADAPCAASESRGEFDLLALALGERNSSCSHSDYFSPSVQVLPSPGKGRGLFAAAPLPTYSVVAVQRALALSPTGDDLFHRLRATLAADRTAAEPLLAVLSGWAEGGTEDDRLRAVVARNAFGTSQCNLQTAAARAAWAVRLGRAPTDEEEAAYSVAQCESTGEGVWAGAAACLNHSCARNCDWLAFGDLLCVVTVRDVAVHEELCFSYLPDVQTLSVAARRRALKRGPWGFACACDRCVTEATPIPGGDASRISVQRMRSLLAAVATAAAAARASADALASRRSPPVTLAARVLAATEALIEAEAAAFGDAPQLHARPTQLRLSAAASCAKAGHASAAAGAAGAAERASRGCAPFWGALLGKEGFEALVRLAAMEAALSQAQAGAMMQARGREGGAGKM